MAGTHLLKPLIQVLCISLCVVTTISKSIPPEIDTEDAVEFLQFNGYAQGYGERTDLTDEEIMDAFEEFQEFYGLPVTGKLDEDTANFMMQDRCGTPDKKSSRYMIQVVKWSRDIKWSLDYTSPELSVAEVHSLIEESIKVWTSQMNLKITEAINGEVAEMIFSFVHPDALGYHGGPSPFASTNLAHAFYPGTGSLAGDVHVNLNFTYCSPDPPCASGYSLKHVLVHEIGHALGLKHTNLTDAVMYPYTRNGVAYAQLHSDDIAGIQDLYGQKESFQVNGHHSYRFAAPHSLMTMLSASCIIALALLG